MEELAQLEGRLTGSSDDIRSLSEDIARLYELCESGDLRVVAEALKVIPHALAHHRGRVRAAAGGGGNGAAAALVTWLNQHAEAYHAVLARLATSDKPRAQVCAIRLALTNIRDEAEEAQAPRRSGSSDPGATAVLALAPPDQRIQSLLDELLLALRWRDHAAQSLMGEFVAEYVDVRHYVLTHLRYCTSQCGKAQWASNYDLSQEPAAKRRKHTEPFVDSMRSRGLAPEDLFARVFAFLRDAPEPRQAAQVDGAPEEDAAEAAVLAPTGRPLGFFLREQRRLYQDAWVQLLSLPVSVDQCKAVLQLLPARVIPHLSQPLLLADFYLRAFHSGSTEVSVLSLSGLLLLLTRHGLGDPETLSSSCSEFYAQLYSLIRPDTFKLRRRARFQRLVAASLSSGLLPARFAAVFAKKCMRVAVSCADPGTIMWLVAVAYSLIQKHHSHCKYLVHRADSAGRQALPPEGSAGGGAEKRPPAADGAAAAPAGDGDPFESAAPLSTALEQAAGTSLWELQPLRRHHIPAVSVLVKLFERPFFKPTARKLDPELFLDQGAEQTYKQLLKQGERQAARWKTRGEKCPLAFRVEDDEAAARVAGLAAGLSTSQRRLGPVGA